MDEGLLNDLLECSVCLERLDTSSRVLPCQHTFCLKCLKVIVESHKELRCPECRVLVETKVEELPPNVLLMRILEGMRNSAPRKPGGTHRALRSGHSMTQPPGQQARGDIKQVPPHARAMYDYISKEQGDLSFKKGETILLQKKLDPYWYQGECSGRTGVFPITYVQVVVPLQVPTALCKALYDFRMSAPDEEGCLAFDKGAIITVHRRVDENWAEGRLEQRVGIFPIAFVELNQAARQLMNSTPLNRAVPPIPEHTRAGHSEHRHHIQHTHRYQPMTTSMPTAAPAYQNVGTMSASQPAYTLGAGAGGAAPAGPGAGGALVALAHGKHALDLLHFSAKGRLEPVRAKDAPAHAPRHEPPAASDTSSSANTPSVTTPSAGSSSEPHTGSDTSTSDSAEPSLPASPDAADVCLDRTQLADRNHQPHDRNHQLNERNHQLNERNHQPTERNHQPNERNHQPAERNHQPCERSQQPCERSQSAGAEEAAGESSTATNTSLNVSLPGARRPLLPLAAPLAAALAHDAPRRDARRAPAAHHHHRHSAEIVTTSLLDHVAEPRERRRRRERSSERALPAAYVALYPYKPQKPDELELKKGGVYTVSERCRDGWYKGWCTRSARGGVFPGNYVTAAPHAAPPRDKPAPANVSKSACGTPAPPDAPPRANSPHAQPQLTYPWNSQSQSQQSTPRLDKSKDKSRVEKSSISTGVSLMKRLAAMKKCKSPPPVGYSMDNPVFEDGPGTSLMLNLAQHHPVHVRTSTESPWQSQHRKSQSLDVTAVRKDRHHSQTVKERFRCIVPYPPNSEYELELKVDDIVIVSKKRGDGWYKGTLQRTGRTGLFPASFVQSCPQE